MNYTPLYVLSEYSMLNSTCHIDELLARIKDYGYDSFAVTDIGGMYGCLKIYHAAEAAGLKYIIGLKVPYNVNGRTSNILLYAKNLDGYHNLLKISSRYKITNAPLDIKTLGTYDDGIIAVTPGNENFCYVLARNNAYQELNDYLNLLKNTFSDFYVGLGVTTTYENENLDGLYNLYKSMDCKMVAVQPVFFIDDEDKESYRVLKAIGNNAVIEPLSESEQSSYLLTLDEMNFVFRNHLDLLDNSTEIKNKCNVKIEFGKLQLPEYQEGLDSKQYLLELSVAGLKKRLQTIRPNNPQIYYDRLKMELDTINKMGFADYFLIVYDYVKFAKKSGIYVGPGRGSAGASLVAYCLGITNVDPLKYNLLFERFLNPERITMPDIDIDFPDNRRDEVIQYVGSKYGSARVAHIGTFGTFQVKLAVNDVSRVYKLSEIYAKEISKILKKALSQKSDSANLSTIISENPKLKQLMDENEEINQVLSVAVKIQGLPRNISTHAAGIIITKYDLVNFMPLDNGLDDIYQTQYEAPDLESLGLLKMDFLGLKNLNNIATTIDLIKQENPNFKMPQDENDPKVFAMLAKGDVVGVFQLESEGMRNVIIRLHTSSMNDIISALALYRPGPMDMINHFIDRKFGREKVEYPHEDLREILKETYGTIVYQEQIMQIAQKFAGYNLGKADILRRAVSKKKQAVLEEERGKFVESSMRLGYKREDAEVIYDYIVKFANYGFNKAHSVAYAKVVYQTAYLKCYYPSYYMSTLMTTSLGSEKDILDYYKEAIKLGIKVYPPAINRSVDYFASYNDGILFPLTIVKGLGEVKSRDIVKERAKGKFINFKDFILRTKDIIPLSVVSSLIYSGALDEFGLTKKAMMDTAERHIQLAEYENLPNMLAITYTDEEYSFGELVAREKEAIGLNLTYNFFLTFARLYQERNLIHLKDVKIGMRVRTLGRIQDMRIITTKKNEQMAFFNLEDDSTMIEVVCFPSVFRMYQDLKDGLIIQVEGTCNKNERNNNIQIMLDNLIII